MIKALSAAIGLGMIVCACATTDSSAGTTYTTSGDVRGRCLQDDVSCSNNADCCSLLCENQVCVRKEP